MGVVVVLPIATKAQRLEKIVIGHANEFGPGGMFSERFQFAGVRVQERQIGFGFQIGKLDARDLESRHVESSFFVTMNQQPLQFAHYRPAYQRWLVWLALALVAAPLNAQQQRVGFRRVRTVDFGSATFSGAALMPGNKITRHILAWGTDVSAIRLPGGKALKISPDGGFGGGGCVFDVNGDNQPDLVLFEKGQPDRTGRMVWLEAPHGALHVIDAEAESSDCLPTSMFGKKGVVVLHRHAQLRFYEIPADPAETWPSHEIGRAHV